MSVPLREAFGELFRPWQQHGPLVLWACGVLAHRYHNGVMARGWERWNALAPGERDAWMRTAREMLAGRYGDD